MDGDRLAQLEEQIRSGSVFQCKLALDELETCPSEQVVPIFQKILNEKDVVRRRFAVMGLAHHQTEESFEVLKRLLENEKDSNILAEAANSIFDFGPHTIPLLQAVFHRNDNWLVRQSIVSILMEANDDDALLDVVKVGIQDETQTAKETAILALGKVLKGPHHDEAVELLATLSSSPNWRDRWRAATSLSLASGEKAKTLLAQLKQDDHHRVVAAALDAEIST